MNTFSPCVMATPDGFVIVSEGRNTVLVKLVDGVFFVTRDGPGFERETERVPYICLHRLIAECADAMWVHRAWRGQSSRSVEAIKGRNTKTSKVLGKAVKAQWLRLSSQVSNADWEIQRLLMWALGPTTLTAAHFQHFRWAVERDPEAMEEARESKVAAYFFVNPWAFGAGVKDLLAIENWQVFVEHPMSKKGPLERILSAWPGGCPITLAPYLALFPVEFAITERAPLTATLMAVRKTQYVTTERKEAVLWRLALSSSKEIKAAMSARGLNYRSVRDIDKYVSLSLMEA